MPHFFTHSANQKRTAGARPYIEKGQLGHQQKLINIGGASVLATLSG